MNRKLSLTALVAVAAGFSFIIPQVAHANLGTSYVHNSFAWQLPLAVGVAVLVIMMALVLDRLLITGFATVAAVTLALLSLGALSYGAWFDRPVSVLAWGLGIAMLAFLVSFFAQRVAALRAIRGLLNRHSPRTLLVMCAVTLVIWVVATYVVGAFIIQRQFDVSYNILYTSWLEALAATILPFIILVVWLGMLVRRATRLPERQANKSKLDFPLLVFLFVLDVILLVSIYRSYTYYG